MAFIDEVKAGSRGRADLIEVEAGEATQALGKVTDPGRPPGNPSVVHDVGDVESHDASSSYRGSGAVTAGSVIAAQVGFACRARW